MGREGENLPLARASRPSAAGAERRVPCLADYSGGRLSFGNERAAPLAFPCAPIVAAIGRHRNTVRISARHFRAQARPRYEGALRASRAAKTSSTTRG
jgi:hypothetical protein